MATKNNRRTLVTKRILRESLIELMKEKPISKISIKEICDLSEMSRSTFYLHYQDQFELLADVEREILENTEQSLGALDGAFNTTEGIQAFLEYVKDNKETFGIMLCQPETEDFQKRIIDQIENNVLTANNFVMNTDIKDFNPSLLKTQGTLDFNTKEVEIRDIDKLLNTSKLLKVMFTSVKVVQKAFNFAKLDNSSITNGIIKCSMLSAEYALKDGVVDIIKSDIDSDLTVVKATGKADLLKDAIDMKIQAQLANKPIVIKVKGPLSDPSYKVDVLSSLSSIVKNSGESSDTNETKKDVASSAGEVIKSIGSLFKKSK